MSKKIEVILVEPLKPPRIVEINDDLASMQKLVEGDIEHFIRFDDNAVIIANGEGKTKRMPLNRAFYHENGQLADIAVGPFFITYAPIESENCLSLPEELKAKYMEKFKHPQEFLKTSKGIEVISVNFIDLEEETKTMATRLCEKMRAEKEAFIAGLISKAPEDIINSAYEIVAKEEIVIAAESKCKLSEDEAEALCKAEKPLERIYQEWLGCSMVDFEVLSEIIKVEAQYCKDLEDAGIKQPKFDVKSYSPSISSTDSGFIDKAELNAEQKPEDIYWGDKEFSIGVDCFENKNDRDNFYESNDMSDKTPKSPFRDKTYYSAISIVSNKEMKLFKGEARAASKPDAVFKGDRKISLDIEFFERKKDRDKFIECNDVEHDQDIDADEQPKFITSDYSTADERFDPGYSDRESYIYGTDEFEF